MGLCYVYSAWHGVATGAAFNNGKMIGNIRLLKNY